MKQKLEDILLYALLAFVFVATLASIVISLLKVLGLA